MSRGGVQSNLSVAADVDGSSDFWQGPWDVQALPSLMQAIDAWAMARKWDELFVFQVRLIAEELVVNVMTHAQPRQDQLRSSGWVRVEVFDQAAPWRVVISDNAQTFDPTAQESPDLHAGLDERAVGGLGVHLAMQMCDRLVHQALPQGNRLTAFKHPPAAS